jgi:hypothetical protein
MAMYQIERRRCHRFEIPGAEVRYKKTGLFVFRRGFSGAYPVVNVSKGGLVFLCEEKLRSGQKVMVQVLIPKESPLNLRARVRWQGRPMPGANVMIGLEFLPFGSRRGRNPREALDVLRMLDMQHGKEG